MHSTAQVQVTVSSLMCSQLTLLYSRNEYNIVKQLYPDKINLKTENKSKKKKLPSALDRLFTSVFFPCCKHSDMFLKSQSPSLKCLGFRLRSEICITSHMTLHNLVLAVFISSTATGFLVV